MNRRDFFKNTLTGLLGVVVLPKFELPELMKERDAEIEVEEEALPIAGYITRATHGYASSCDQYYYLEG